MLVKLINNSKTRDMTFRWDGKDYELTSNGGYIIVDADIAKHWLGDWDLKDESELAVERRRVSRLHNNYPDPDLPIDVQPVEEAVKGPSAPKAPKGSPQSVNPFVKTSVPDEEEFEDLKEIKKKTKKKK